MGKPSEAPGPMQAVLFRRYLGQSLEAQRKRAKLSRKAVADVLAVDESTVWRWEMGKVWPEDSDVVAAVYAREADVSPLALWTAATELASAARAEGDLASFPTRDFPRVEWLDRSDAEEAGRSVRSVDGGSGPDPEP